MGKKPMNFRVRKFGCESYIICPILVTLHSPANPQFSHWKNWNNYISLKN